MAFGKKKGVKSVENVETPVDRLRKRFKPSTELPAVRGVKVGIYANPKVGKTHFSLTAPLPIFVIDTEGSAKMISKYFDEKRQSQIYIDEIIQWVGKKKGKFDIVGSLKSMEESIDTITDVILLSEKGADELSEEEKERMIIEPGVTGTIVIDSGTDMWDWLSTWLELEGATKFNKSDNSMNRTEWGKANKKYADFMYLLLRCNWNVIWTFRARPVIDARGADVGITQARYQKNTPFWLECLFELVQDGMGNKMIYRGGRFGLVGKIPDLKDPDWPALVKHLEKYSGIKIG